MARHRGLHSWSRGGKEFPFLLYPAESPTALRGATFGGYKFQRAFKWPGKRRTLPALAPRLSPPGVPLALILASTDLR
eukprot:1143692-Prymnesium_polylepis.1